MTPEEFKQQQTQLLSELEDIQNQELIKRGEIKDLKIAFCSYLKEKYAEFIGKKVRIRFSTFDFWKNQTEYRELVGFLHGFSFGYAYVGNSSIYPDVYKVKKDGSESKNKYTAADIRDWESITDIKLES